MNDIVEQDHRGIKRRCTPMLGFKSFETASVTIAGIELAHQLCALVSPFGLESVNPSGQLVRLADTAFGRKGRLPPVTILNAEK